MPLKEQFGKKYARGVMYCLFKGLKKGNLADSLLSPMRGAIFDHE
jgi:hypothetical protein